MRGIPTRLAGTCLYSLSEHDSRGHYLFRCIELRGTHTTRHNLVLESPEPFLRRISDVWHQICVAYTVLWYTDQTSSLRATVAVSVFLTWSSSKRPSHRPPRLQSLRRLALPLDSVQIPSGASMLVSMRINTNKFPFPWKLMASSTARPFASSRTSLLLLLATLVPLVIAGAITIVPYGEATLASLMPPITILPSPD